MTALHQLYIPHRNAVPAPSSTGVQTDVKSILSASEARIMSANISEHAGMDLSDAYSTQQQQSFNPAAFHSPARLQDSFDCNESMNLLNGWIEQSNNFTPPIPMMSKLEASPYMNQMSFSLPTHPSSFLSGNNPSNMHTNSQGLFSPQDLTDVRDSYEYPDLVPSTQDFIFDDANDMASPSVSLSPSLQTQHSSHVPQNQIHQYQQQQHQLQQQQIQQQQQQQQYQQQLLQQSHLLHQQQQQQQYVQPQQKSSRSRSISKSTSTIKSRRARTVSSSRGRQNEVAANIVTATSVSGLPSVLGVNSGPPSAWANASFGIGAPSLSGNSSNYGLVSPSISAMSMVSHSLPAMTEEDHLTRQKELALEKKQRRRDSHNAVERRRREVVNASLNELAELIPESMNFTPDPAGAIADLDVYGGQNSPQVGNYDDLEERGQAGKANKSEVLRKSVNYIKHLQQRTANLEAEIQMLRGGRGDRPSSVSTSDSVLNPAGLNIHYPITDSAPGSTEVKQEQIERFDNSIRHSQRSADNSALDFGGSDEEFGEDDDEAEEIDGLRLRR